MEDPMPQDVAVKPKRRSKKGADAAGEASGDGGNASKAGRAGERERDAGPRRGSPERAIRVRGAKEHNLKNIDLELPRDCLVVMTGLSGSGKSSLAFDTIYPEGQRRYVESLSSYARQFLGQMDKPDVD
ncbi:MAG: hypothetical protein KDA05_05915, partial [Phycisphaerales bacterium]|nr:hypothetical protein [Phycisphaerales bacterium]